VKFDGESKKNILKIIFDAPKWVNVPKNGPKCAKNENRRKIRKHLLLRLFLTLLKKRNMRQSDCRKLGPGKKIKLNEIKTSNSNERF